jgi:hypothetical protein
MKWTIELVKANHYIERDYQKQLAYYDTSSECFIPMHESLCPRDILLMEEWSQSDDGMIFMDYKTHQIGLLIRG